MKRCSFCVVHRPFRFPSRPSGFQYSPLPRGRWAERLPLLWSIVSDIFPGFDQESDEPHRRPSRTARRIGLVAYSLVLVLAAVLCTLAFSGSDDQGSEDPGASSTGPANSTSTTPLSFGAEDEVVASVTVPADATGPALLHFDLTAEEVPTSTAHAVMISGRVECRSGDASVEMQATGKVSTNVLVSRGGSMSGQALTVETGESMECELLASAPFAESSDGELTSLPLRATLEASTGSGAHVPALHRLEDATLFTPGMKKTVLSRRVDDPSSLDQMSSTVRLTSCTVVGGSRDGDGANKCRKGMTGKESSTARVQVIARWLDEDGDITSTTTYWDETLSINYSTHHTPWNLRQAHMADLVPEDASGVVLTVQVESVAGTPFVVHADGTDSVITTGR